MHAGYQWLRSPNGLSMVIRPFSCLYSMDKSHNSLLNLNWLYTCIYSYFLSVHILSLHKLYLFKKFVGKASFLNFKTRKCSSGPTPLTITAVDERDTQSKFFVTTAPWQNLQR